MFVPVSPSGTGYTFSRLIAAAWAFIVSRKRDDRAAQGIGGEPFQGRHGCIVR